MTRYLSWAGGLVLITHSLVHLLVWPGAPLGDPGTGTRLRWSGGSWSGEPDWLPPVAISATGGTLLAGALLGCLVGGLALLGLPGARRFPLLANAIGAACSLLMFALIWPGLEPEPSEFAAGPVLSGTLLVGVGVVALLRRRANRTDDSPADPTPGSPAADPPSRGPTAEPA